MRLGYIMFLQKLTPHPFFSRHLAFFSLIGLASCASETNNMGCMSLIAVRIGSDSAPVPHGRYEFEIELNDLIFSSECDLTNKDKECPLVLADGMNMPDHLFEPLVGSNGDLTGLYINFGLYSYNDASDYPEISVKMMDDNGSMIFDKTTSIVYSHPVPTCSHGEATLEFPR